jgi:hypothetical protein
MKTLELNQMEILEGGGGGWSAFGGAMAFTGVCGIVGLVTSAAVTPIGGFAISMACGAIFGGLNAFNT